MPSHEWGEARLYQAYCFDGGTRSFFSYCFVVAASCSFWGPGVHPVHPKLVYCIPVWNCSAELPVLLLEINAATPEAIKNGIAEFGFLRKWGIQRQSMAIFMTNMMIKHEIEWGILFSDKPILIHFPGPNSRSSFFDADIVMVCWIHSRVWSPFSLCLKCSCRCFNHVSFAQNTHLEMGQTYEITIFGGITIH